VYTSYIKVFFLLGELRKMELKENENSMRIEWEMKVKMKEIDLEY